MACGPLDGTTVVDMTHMWAGPTCTQMLGDLGAEVIKVEPPGGDRSRGGIAPKNGWVSPIYLAVNRNKRSIVIDLTKEEGRKVMYRLTERADVFIHNFRQKAVEKLKVSYEKLKVINPRLIYASVSGYGAKGPGKDLPGQDLQLQAFGGLLSVTGYSDEPRPSPPVGVSLVDSVTGIIAVVGVLGALHQRDRTGRGEELKTSLLAGALSLQGNILVPYLATRKLPGKAGNGHPLTPPPFGVWKASDGKELAISGGGDEAWSECCIIIGKPELGSDPRFATRAARLENRDELFDTLQEAFATRPRDEWVRQLRAAGLWVTQVCDYEELCASSQVKNNEMLVEVPHPTGGTFTALNTPVAFTEGSTSIRRPPPLLGEHTREILAELDYCDKAIDSLYACGTVA